MTFPRALAKILSGAVNEMALRSAGHAAVADLEHVGRNTGAVRHTSVRAFLAGDTVVIGLLRHVAHTTECVRLPIERASPVSVSAVAEGRGAHGR